MRVFVFERSVTEEQGFPFDATLNEEEIKKERVIYLTQLIYNGDKRVEVMNVTEFERFYNWESYEEVVTRYILIDDITFDDVPTEKLREMLIARRTEAQRKAREARKKEGKYFYFEGVIDKKIGISDSPQRASYSIISDFLKGTRYGQSNIYNKFKVDTNVFSRFNLPRKGDTVKIRALNLKSGPKLETAKIIEVIKKED